MDGWVHTGDEVMINESMEIFIVDRIKASVTQQTYRLPIDADFVPMCRSSSRFAASKVRHI